MYNRSESRIFKQESLLKKTFVACQTENVGDNPSELDSITPWCIDLADHHCLIWPHLPLQTFSIKHNIELHDH
ncbi:hypothetical protein BLNAU_23434 [Blattamonas nauphoetae]|uniref:Uncharacterized protein n=1 Tax=Blattamonas nauphoetae TaxID=2049346 RepID=A0ABQ9WSE3_9EUKA|nr:hypothetical protein BLNAU_23434 [Blattamonas nauphoetae]